jgi:hypothetical protein
MSQTFACFTHEAFLVRSRTSGLGTSLLKCQHIRISKLSDDILKEFHCIIIYNFTFCEMETKLKEG